MKINKPYLQDILNTIHQEELLLLNSDDYDTNIKRVKLIAEIKLKIHALLQLY